MYIFYILYIQSSAGRQLSLGHFMLATIIKTSIKQKLFDRIVFVVYIYNKCDYSMTHTYSYANNNG